jgi:hypothetical protein
MICRRLPAVNTGRVLPNGPVDVEVQSIGASAIQALKCLASTTHRVAARDVRLASCYLRLFRSLKLLPDGRWKQFVVNSLQSIR